VASAFASNCLSCQKQLSLPYFSCSYKGFMVIKRAVALFFTQFIVLKSQGSVTVHDNNAWPDLYFSFA